LDRRDEGSDSDSAAGGGGPTVLTAAAEPALRSYIGWSLGRVGDSQLLTPAAGGGDHVGQQTESRAAAAGAVRELWSIFVRLL
jgi:hypothetical protein